MQILNSLYFHNFLHREENNSPMQMINAGYSSWPLQQKHAFRRYELLSPIRGWTPFHCNLDDSKQNFTPPHMPPSNDLTSPSGQSMSVCGKVVSYLYTHSIPPLHTGKNPLFQPSRSVFLSFFLLLLSFFITTHLLFTPFCVTNALAPPLALNPVPRKELFGSGTKMHL